MKHGYHSLNLEGKRITKFGLEKKGARPQIARRSRSVKRVLYALVFDARGIVARFQFLDTRLSLVSTTLNKFYLLLLTTICRRVNEPGCGAWSFSTTTPQPTAQPWCRTIWKHKDLKLYHIPRTVHLTPCDFWLNPVIEKCLSGRKFETRTAVGRALFQCTDNIPKCDYKSALKIWIKRLKKCVEVKGEYFEGLD